MAAARLIRAVTGIVVGLIVLAVVLHLLRANPHNAIVSDIHDAGNWLVGPFRNLFSVKDHDLHMILNWGLAAVIYSLIGGLISNLLARSAVGGYGRMRPVT